MLGIDVNERWDEDGVHIDIKTPKGNATYFLPTGVARSLSEKLEPPEKDE